jgi:hypothetical protein
MRYTSDHITRVRTYVALHDANGAECAYADARELALEPGRPASVVFTLLPYIEDFTACRFQPAPPGQRPSHRTETLSVKLGELQPGAAVRYQEARFDLPYAWSAVGRSAAAAPPTIARLDWAWSGLGRDRLSIQCLVHDEKGDPLDVGMAIETESCLARDACWRSTVALPARALGRDAPARKDYGYVDFGTRIEGQLTCSAEDAHGNRATRSVPICIDGPEGSPCLPR